MSCSIVVLYLFYNCFIVVWSLPELVQELTRLRLLTSIPCSVYLGTLIDLKTSQHSRCMLAKIQPSDDIEHGAPTVGRPSDLDIIIARTSVSPIFLSSESACPTQECAVTTSYGHRRQHRSRMFATLLPWCNSQGSYRTIIEQL